MNEILHVHVLDSANHLIGEHEHGLHGEPPTAEVEEVLQRRPQQVHHQAVILALNAVEANVRDADATLQNLVHFALVEQLRMTSLR